MRTRRGDACVALIAWPTHAGQTASPKLCRPSCVARAGSPDAFRMGSASQRGVANAVGRSMHALLAGFASLVLAACAGARVNTFDPSLYHRLGPLELSASIDQNSSEILAAVDVMNTS